MRLVPRLQERQQLAALLDLELDVHAGLPFGEKIATPSRKQVRPGFDSIDVPARGRRNEARRPTIVRVQPHGNARPFVGCLRFPQQLSRQHGVAITEDIRPHIHRLADNAFDCKTACIDKRVDILDVNVASGNLVDRLDSHIGCHGWLMHGLFSHGLDAGECWWNR